MSVRLKSLALDSSQTSSNDSFSSDPGTRYNRGAADFLSLVEQALARNSMVSFSELVAQMLDLEIGQRVATPDDIPARLNSNGWKVDQVSSIWIVASAMAYSSQWDHVSLQRLGGRNIMADTWS